MTPKQAGWRLILLSLPFLAFGLLWALRPPLADRLGAELTSMMQVLGVAMALLAVASMTMGVFLVRRRDARIL